MTKRERGALRVTGARDWTPADDEWQRHAVLRQIDALPQLRASAERWAGGLATLLSAVSLGTVLAGPDRFDALAAPYETVAEVAFLLAATAATLALAAALAASVVTSKKLFLATGPAIRKASREATLTALRQLAVSRWSAGAALVLLLGVAGLTVVSPIDSPASTPEHATPAPAHAHADSAKRAAP